MRSVQPQLQAILDAIARARLADRRLRLASSLCDEDGVQLTYQAFLHNLTVIAETIKATPAEVFERDPETPWSEFAAMGDPLGRDYLHIDPAAVRRTVEEVLDPLELAVRRLAAAR
jgi:uncharacterized protein with HEPN domain